MNAQNVGSIASRNAAIQQAYIQGGFTFDPAQLAAQSGLSQSDLTGILTPAVQKQADEANTSGVSTSARLQQSNKDAMLNIHNALTAHGLLRSGETGYELGKEQQAYTNNQFDARNQLLQALYGYQQGYLTAAEQRAEAEAQAISEAADRQFQLWAAQLAAGGGGGGGGGSAPAPAAAPAPAPAPNNNTYAQYLASVKAGGPTLRQMGF